MTNQEKHDNASLVPKYHFGETLEQQEAELAANPLLQRMLRRRKELEQDPYRPLYHYVNPEGNLNDPNGLCFWQGRWHLFYQAYPPEDARQHWGHAVSPDLIHWRDLPYAIYPGPERCCLSGSILVEEDRAIAMYHGTLGNMVAVSNDPLLLNWEKVTGQPVITTSGTDGSPLPYRVHDPCIWKKDGTYYALSNGRDWWRDMEYLFKSEDLEHWESMHPFVENDRFTLVGDDGACPYFWPIGDRHILVFFSHMSGGQYLLGDYDTNRDKFVATAHGKFNFGAYDPAGVHAPSATPDGRGGLIVIFNMNPGKHTEGWDQIMTLPRRLTLFGQDPVGRADIAIEPAGDVESMRHDHQHVGKTTLPANREIVLETIQGNAMELSVQINPKDAPMVELNILRSPEREEFTRFAFYKDRGFSYLLEPGQIGFTRRPSLGLTLGQHGRPPMGLHSLVTLGTSYSSTLPDVLSRAPETAPLRFEAGELLTLRVFVDRSVVEVFVNGQQCVAARVYPGRQDSVGVSLRSQGQDAVLVGLDAWQMKSVYS